MTTNPAFIRHVCQAKGAELSGDAPKAIAHIEWAAQLAVEHDDRLQLAAWRSRLESLAAQPARKRRAKQTSHEP